MQLHETNAAPPDRRSGEDQRLERAIDAALDCSQACSDCADACIADGLPASLRQCVRLALDCADLCEVTVSL
ncbi:MAG: four-helix bundle copper-binding protein, partial [Burkholderiales bacterium]